jgi:UDP-N-acetylmuramate dehydrogenase
MNACRAGWRGLESACGIPGSVGGAAVMNAGAYGFSISDVMTDIVVYDERGRRQDPPEGWRFHYRGSSIPEGSAVAEITVQLRPDDPVVLEKETGEISRQRSKSQPGGRNAGCVFKNPEGGQAGKLIDGLGLKGTRRGGASISERHANFLVNDRGAKAQDVLDLLELVHEQVEREAGVDLELEVKVWRPRA